MVAVATVLSSETLVVADVAGVVVVVVVVAADTFIDASTVINT